MYTLEISLRFLCFSLCKDSIFKRDTIDYFQIVFSSLVIIIISYSLRLCSCKEPCCSQDSRRIIYLQISASLNYFNSILLLCFCYKPFYSNLRQNYDILNNYCKFQDIHFHCLILLFPLNGSNLLTHFFLFEYPRTEQPNCVCEPSNFKVRLRSSSVVSVD